MGDNSMYWNGDQSTWYRQHPHQPGPHPPPPYQQSNSYQIAGGAVASESNQTPPLQIHHVQQQQHPPQPQPHPQPHSQVHAHSHPHQQPPPPQLHHQMLPNGMSNGGLSMQSPLPCPPQQAPPNQPVTPMNHYSPQLNTMHQETSVPASNMQQQQPQQQQPPQHDSSSYQMHPQAYAQHQSTAQPGPMYAQPSPYSNMLPAQAAPNSRHPNMQPQQPSQHAHVPQQPQPQSQHQQQQQQQQPQPHQQQQQQAHYPQQQYSPPTYWNSAQPMHNQHAYGQASVQQGPPQNVPTPPATIPDNMSYHNNSAQQQIPQQPPPPPPHSNMPYDSRGPNMSANYTTLHQPHPNAGYYSPHDIQQPPPPPPNPAMVTSYDMSQQHHSGAQNNWTNGYYQPSQSPYPPSVMNPYPPPITYNGANPSIVSQSPVHAPVQGHPQSQVQPPHYPHHIHHPHQPQYSQQCLPQNHTKPSAERNKVIEKKPVKPRGPRKQSNPNAPTGRRKRPFMTEEHKQSGYAKFYQIKRKELNVNDFSEASKLISDLWNRLSDDEKSTYAQDVSNKRKEMLKKKASQQAQNLLVQGITQEQEVTLPEK